MTSVSIPGAMSLTSPRCRSVSCKRVWTSFDIFANASFATCLSLSGKDFRVVRSFHRDAARCDEYMLASPSRVNDKAY